MYLESVKKVLNHLEFNVPSSNGETDTIKNTTIIFMSLNELGLKQALAGLNWIEKLSSSDSDQGQYDRLSINLNIPNEIANCANAQLQLCPNIDSIKMKLIHFMTSFQDILCKNNCLVSRNKKMVT